MTVEDKAGKGGGDGKAGEHKGRASKFTEVIKSTVKRSASLLSPKRKGLKKGKLMFTFVKVRPDAHHVNVVDTSKPLPPLPSGTNILPPLRKCLGCGSQGAAEVGEVAETGESATIGIRT